MKRVTGIGGIFFKSKDPKALAQWYQQHLGINIDDYNCHVFEGSETGQTVWSPFAADTKYFEPAGNEFMINYRVENLVWLLDQLRSEGVTVMEKMEEYDYGKFGWIIDPEGRKIELWEPMPPAAEAASE